MTLEIQLYDALESLGGGSVLTRIGQAFNQTYLDGAPFAATLFPVLKRNGWIAPLGNASEGAIERFGISKAGRRMLDQAREWYYSLPMLERLAARAGFPV